MRVCFLLLLAFFCSGASAHRFAPSLLEIRQHSEDTFSATWKTPIQKVSAVAMEPVFPASCEITSASPWIQEGTGVLMQMDLACPEGLVGKMLAVSGLGDNQSSALLRLYLCLLYTSPSPRDQRGSRMPSSA